MGFLHLYLESTSSLAFLGIHRLTRRFLKKITVLHEELFIGTINVFPALFLLANYTPSGS